MSIQAILNAVIIGIFAKLLVALIVFITNIAFYGRFSLQPVSPAGNHLGWLGCFLFLLRAAFGLVSWPVMDQKPSGGTASLKQWKKLLWKTAEFLLSLLF